MLSGKSIQFIFRRLSNKGNEVVEPTLIRACQAPIRAVSRASLSLTSLTVTLRPCKDKFVSLRWPNTSSSYASITTNFSLWNWTWRLVLLSRKKDYNLIFKFIQPREAFASRQPTDFGIRQKSHMLRSHFSGQKLEEPVIFCPRTNEGDCFDCNVHNFHQM